MKYRRLDANGDMQYGSRLQDFHIDSPEGVAQSVVTRIKLWEKEWFLDLADGTQYDSSIMGTHKAETATPAIRARVLETEGVVSIDEFETYLDADARVIHYTITLTTIYGVISVEGTI